MQTASRVTWIFQAATKAEPCSEKEFTMILNEQRPTGPRKRFICIDELKRNNSDDISRVSSGQNSLKRIKVSNEPALAGGSHNYLKKDAYVPSGGSQEASDRFWGKASSILFDNIPAKETRIIKISIISGNSESPCFGAELLNPRSNGGYALLATVIQKTDGYEIHNIQERFIGGEGYPTREDFSKALLLAQEELEGYRRPLSTPKCAN
jgi:hypothetical protein